MNMTAKFGVCWLLPEQWQQAKEVFVDSHGFGATYDDWKKTTENAIAQLQAAGALPVKVEIDLSELKSWCKEKRVEVNVKSCSEFISMLMKEKK